MNDFKYNSSMTPVSSGLAQLFRTLETLEECKCT